MIDNICQSVEDNISNIELTNKKDQLELYLNYNSANNPPQD